MTYEKERAEYLQTDVQHIDVKAHDVTALVDSMARMSFRSRGLANAAKYYEQMLRDPHCTIILGLAGSLVSAGLKQVIVDMIDHNMVDVIVSTGANIVDQDFFEALGYRHYIGSPRVDDQRLRSLHIDRIYDTLIDEDQLKECDMTIAELANSLDPRPYSSREFIGRMGRWLVENGFELPSIVRRAYEQAVPIFCPAFSDSSASFGLVHHQWNSSGEHITIDSVRDFRELTGNKLRSTTTGIFLVGGGVPKNFIQDTVVAGEVLGYSTPMHKYAIQITVADERDGGLSGSTLREACSWGKVETSHEQLVYCEATLAMPLIVGYGYHKKAWEDRTPQRRADSFGAGSDHEVDKTQVAS